MRALCIYVDGGKGHYVPAKAVQAEFEKIGIETKLEEFFSYLDIQWIGKINKKFWQTMLKHTSLEKKLSPHNDGSSQGMKTAIKFAKKHCELALKSNLDEFPANFVFATHPYASTIISEMLFDMGINIPVYYFATDVFSAPKASICDKLRKFYISTKEGADVVSKMAQGNMQIEICPFPLQQSIAHTQIETKSEARRKLNLDEDLFTLQINLGGEGLGSLELFEQLLIADKKMQIIFLGGIADKMRKKILNLKNKYNPTKTKIVIAGFVSNVQDYLAASDIVAGRAGINTIVEAIYYHRPFLITELVYTVIPSASYIEKYQVGWNTTDDISKQKEIIFYFVNNPKELELLDNNFNNIPIEYNAEKFASMIINDVQLYKLEINKRKKDYENITP